MTLGGLYIVTKRIAQGIAECEHALALDRNLAQAHSIIGLGKTYSGRAEEAEAHIVEALRLSPRDSSACVWMDFSAHAKNLFGHCEQAVIWSRRAIEANRNYLFSYFNLAVALAGLGRLDEARSAIAAVLALNPSFTLSRYRANFLSMTDDPTAIAQMQPVLEAAQMAGVPEQ